MPGQPLPSEPVRAKRSGCVRSLTGWEGGNPLGEPHGGQGQSRGKPEATGHGDSPPPEAGHEGPLHTCSIYANEEAGRRLMAMMELGASKPWPEALELLTGSREMDASAIIDYFAPLMDWLASQNKPRPSTAPAVPAAISVDQLNNSMSN